MALSIDDIYQFCLNLINKNQSGGLPAGKFGRMWNAEQDSFFSDMIGRFQKNTNSKESNNTGLIENETILTKLTPFTKTTPITIAAGIGVRPDDFIYKLALRINGYPVIVVQHSKIAALTDDVIDPPSVPANTYYAARYGKTFSFFPTTVTLAQLDYICQPQDVKWAYGFDAQNRQIYDPVNSIQSLWDDISSREITQRMLKQLGVSFQSSDFQNFGQSVKNSGS